MTSENVGCRALTVLDEVQGARVPAWLLYPTSDPTSTLRFGFYAVDVATDAAPTGRAMPLVVVSHGTGGTPWGYRDLACFLARRGFVVALVEHPGNSRNDDRLARTAANLENRPRHVAQVIDAALADEPVGGLVDRAKVAVIGHSMGGYTALAVAGGKPWALPHETSDGAARRLEVVHDARVKALVLLAPATPWFLPEGSLANVDLPILLRTGERDEITPTFHAKAVERGVRDPAKVEASVVAGGGHFAFMSPFPPELVRPAFPPSQDPPGFDRPVYLRVLEGEVVAFLARTLSSRR